MWLIGNCMSGYSLIALITPQGASKGWLKKNATARHFQLNLTIFPGPREDWGVRSQGYPRSGCAHWTHPGRGRGQLRHTRVLQAAPSHLQRGKLSYIGAYKGLISDGLVQERRNSSASAMEFRLSCTNPLIYIISHDRLIFVMEIPITGKTIIIS